MLNKAITRISDFLLTLEARFGLFFSSLILATVFMACAMLYVQPVFTVTFHGILFSKLSENPFDFSISNNLRYRILSPLIGYLVFLRGNYFFIFPLLSSCIFPAIVYYRYRIKGMEAIDSFLITCFITFSCVVLLPLVAPGYTDVITWIFLFLTFSFIEKTFIASVFFSLALLNHESSIVLLPAIVMQGHQKSGSGFFIVLLYFIAACLPHFLYRLFINEYSPTLYNLSFYLNKGNIFFSSKKLIMYGPAALFYTFKLWWIFPVSYLSWSLLRKKFAEAGLLILILLSACSLVIISYDYTRMLVIAFPAVLLSYEWMLKVFNREKLRKFTLIIITANFLILQYHFNYDGAQPMFSWLLTE